jgi:hypothetical protein
VGSSPPLEAWVLLGVLGLAVAMGARKVAASRSDGGSVPVKGARLVLVPGVLLAVALPVLAAAEGGGSAAVLWWIAAAPPVVTVTSLTGASAAAAIVHWPGRRADPTELTAALLCIGAAATIPLVVGVLVALEVAPTAATAVGLTAGYAVWAAAYSRLSRHG